MLDDPMITQAATIKNVRLGFILLDIYYRRVASHLPLQAMIAAADENEIKLLTDTNKTGVLTEELLVLIAERCSDETSIKQLLTRKVIYKVLQKTTLTVDVLM
ncbi:MAG: hypothetical protein ACRCXC_04835 [Legionella sp.]